MARLCGPLSTLCLEAVLLASVFVCVSVCHCGILCLYVCVCVCLLCGRERKKTEI